VTVLLHAIDGAILSAVWWVLLRPLLETPPLIRSNYRGAGVPTAGGIAIVLGVLTVAAASVVAFAAGWSDDAVAAVSRRLTVEAVIGFGLLGLLDDVLGRTSGGGFRTHLRAARRGHITTGMVKLVGGVLVAVVVAAGVEPLSAGWLLLDAAVVALAANLANLLDRAPARATKLGLVGFAVLVAVEGADHALVGPAMVVGGAAALAVPELREQVMLGDTGANVLGAALGLAAILVLGHSALVVVTIVLAAANLVSEWVSFSAVIDRTPPLRWVDRLGSRRAG
jgi:UDP-N-acetylmuramyl pentapeptide phosphotransferase/UDP-N-acetylglucosamine-1-phosphate transferase